MTKMKNKKRLQFDFTEDAIAEIDKIGQLTGLSTRADVIRHALRFLKWAIDESTENGASLLLEKNGKTCMVLPFWTPAFRGTHVELSDDVAVGQSRKSER